MAVRTILRMGHPILREMARPIQPDEFSSPWLLNLITDMRESMIAAEGIGLAAPQVGESVQVALLGLDLEQLIVVINPQIKTVDSTLSGLWEGCLSVPGLRGYVERPRAVRVEYFDEQGQAKTLDAEGLMATVVQHELDHLFGTLYVDKVTDKTKLVFIEEYRTFVAAKSAADSDSELAD
jgi:peptide deformylase